MKTNFKNRETTLDVFMKFIAMFMALGFIYCGIYMIKLGAEGIDISKTQTVALSIIFIGYGIYRVIRIFQKILEERHVE